MKADIDRQISQYCALLREWNAAYEKQARAAGLNYTSLQVLSAIYSLEDCTQKCIAERCFLPRQTVNSIVTQFFRRGWIEMKERAEDRRTKEIRLTPEGETFASRTLQGIRESERQAMGELSEEQRRQLLETTRLYISRCRQTVAELSGEAGKNSGK